MQKTRARALSAGWRGTGVAAVLALSACTGPDLISLGDSPADSHERYLSPAGDDHNAGTRVSPWKTFARALPSLGPGWTLWLLSGTYEPGTTGTLNVRCVPDATAGSTVPEATVAQNGTPAAAITVSAVSDHQAFLRGSGRVPPVSIDSCQYWTFAGLRAESQDVDDALTTPDTGSVVVLDGANAHVTLTRLLARQPNHHKHAQGIRIGDGASGVTVENCEVYKFHESGIEARRSQLLVITGNYLARDTDDLTMRDTLRPPGPPRGNYGVRLEETQAVYVLNNIAEDVGIGFAVEGRNSDVGADVPRVTIAGNSLRGNIAYMPAIGFRIDSQCNGANPCDGSHTVSDTQLFNDVVFGGDLGVSDAGSVGTRIDQLSIIQAARGVSVAREPPNVAISANTTTTNTLVAGFQSVAFDAGPDPAPWSFSHCDAAGGYEPTLSYRPDDPARVKDKVTTASDLGKCIAYLPAQSQLRSSGVGANVFNQYDNTGQLTSYPLWLPSFVHCGAVIAGVNDVEPRCGTVNERLNAGTAACALP